MGGRKDITQRSLSVEASRSAGLHCKEFGWRCAPDDWCIVQSSWEEALHDTHLGVVLGRDTNSNTF